MCPPMQVQPTRAQCTAGAGPAYRPADFGGEAGALLGAMSHRMCVRGGARMITPKGGELCSFSGLPDCPLPVVHLLISSI